MKKNDFLPTMLVAMLLATVISCKKTEVTTPVTPAPAEDVQSLAALTGLVFQSRFEKGTSTNTNFPRLTGDDFAQVRDLVGFTENLTKSDWQYNLETYTSFGFSNFRINYETGTPTDRFANIVDYPAGNKSLTFVVRNATNPVSYGGKKGRVASDLFSKSRDPYSPIDTYSSGIKEYKQRVKFYIPSSYSILNNYTFISGDFLLLFEFGVWQAVSGSNSNADKKPFRVVFNLIKNAANNGLVFRVQGEDLLANGNFSLAWPATYLNQFPIVGGNWYEAEIYLKEGDTDGADGGRVTFALRKVYYTGSGGWTYDSWTRICDVRNRTIGAGVTAASSTGFTNFAPMKLYAHSNIVERFSDTSPLQIWWDDLSIYTNEGPDAFPRIP